MLVLKEDIFFPFQTLSGKYLDPILSFSFAAEPLSVRSDIKQFPR
jgi:hypothetical protein